MNRIKKIKTILLYIFFIDIFFLFLYHTLNATLNERNIL